MDMEEWVLYSLKEQGWNAEAAHQRLRANMGEMTPNLEYFRRKCRDAAKELWRDLVQKYGVSSLTSREHDIWREMGPLSAYLDPDDAADVRLQEQRRERIRNPRQFTGFKEKKE
jgi:hypothetical protein